MTTKKWLTFTENTTPSKRKTKVWNVYSTFDFSLLGEVRWHAPWRQYTFYTEDGCVWNRDCLRELANFIDQQMQARTKERPDAGLIVHLDDVGEDGPACGAGVGYVTRTVDEVTCENCKAALDRFTKAVMNS